MGLEIVKDREGCRAKVKPHDGGEELGSGDMNRVVKKMTKNLMKE